MQKTTQKPKQTQFKQGDMVEIKFDQSAWAVCKVEVVSQNQNSLALRLMDAEALPWMHGFIHTGAAYRMFLLLRQGGRYFDIGSGNQFEVRPATHD